MIRKLFRYLHLTTLVLFSVNYFSQAQIPAFDWVKPVAGGLYDYAYAITHDDSGNIYVTGSFELVADLDPGPDTAFLYSGSNSDNAFVLKLDHKGNFLWVKQLHSTYQSYGRSIAVDGQGNIYVSGNFSDTAEFDPGEGSNKVKSTYYYDYFIWKLSSQGDLVWVKTIPTTDSRSESAMALDKNNGDIYFTGFFKDTAYVGTTTLINNGTAALNCFVTRLDNAGNFLWARKLEGARSYGITLDDRFENPTIYLSGIFIGTVDFDPGVSNFDLTSNGNTDAYILKLDQAGEFIWAKSWGGTDDDVSRGIVVDAGGNVYSTGQFRRRVDFNPGSGVTDTFFLTNPNAATRRSIFLTKLSEVGEFIWAKQMPTQSTSSNNRGYALAKDQWNNIYCAGDFNSITDFNPGENSEDTFYLSPRNNSLDVFILKTDTAGNFIWAGSFGGERAEALLDIDVDKIGNIYTSGKFIGEVDFDPGSDTFLLTSELGFSTDGFVHKMSQCFYFEAVATVTVQDSILSAVFIPGATYQWINCDSGNAVIVGAYQQDYIVQADGNYAVIVSYSGCSDTSDCLAVKLPPVPPPPVSIGAIEYKGINVFPNPAKDRVTISMEGGAQQSRIRLINITGQVIMEKEVTSGKVFSIDLSLYNAGIYFLEINDNRKSGRIKIVKE